MVPGGEKAFRDAAVRLSGKPTSEQRPGQGERRRRRRGEEEAEEKGEERGGGASKRERERARERTLLCKSAPGHRVR